MSKALASIKYHAHTGKLEEAVDIALGRRPIPKALREDAGEQKQQTQTWFLPDQDKLNRFCMYLENQLGLACTISDSDNGAQGGYQVKVSGNFSENDIANVAGSLNAMRLDNLPGTVA